MSRGRTTAARCAQREGAIFGEQRSRNCSFVLGLKVISRLRAIYTPTAFSFGGLTGAAADVGTMSDEAGNSTKESSPSSSTDTKLGPIGGEREPLVRNREPLAPTHPHPAAHHRRRQLPAPTHTRLHATTALIARSVCSGDVQDRAVRTVEAGPLQLRRGLPGGPYRSLHPHPHPHPHPHSHPHPHQQFAHGEHELLVRCRPAKCAVPLRIPQACPVPRKRGLTAPLLDAGTRPSCVRTSPAASARTVAGATSSTATSCRRRRPSAPLQGALHVSLCPALSRACSAVSCSALSSSDQRRPRPRSCSTRTSTRRRQSSSRRRSRNSRPCRQALRRRARPRQR